MSNINDKCSMLKSVKYFRKKYPSQMFKRILHAPLDLFKVNNADSKKDINDLDLMPLPLTLCNLVNQYIVLINS